MNRTLLALLTFLCLCCKDEGTLPPPPHVPSITLEAVDASCTEAWLRASTTEIPGTIALLRDNQRVLTMRLSAADTLLIDEGLLPHRTYAYQMQKLGADSSVIEASASVQVTTMDTTSHNFSWLVSTLGDGNGSVLRDVTIPSQDVVYAVGSIYKRDSTGGWEQEPYNGAVWSTDRWRLLRIPVRDFGGFLGYYPLYCVFSYSPDDIWTASAADLIQWNGSYWQGKAFFMRNLNFDGQVRMLWGTDASNIWLVGLNGALYRFSGTGWDRLNTNTSVDLLDLWGDSDSGVLWTCGFESDNSESILLRYDGFEWQEYGHSPPWGVYQDLFSSVWFYKGDSAYVVGSNGVFRHQQGSPTGFRRIPIDLGFFPWKIRGNARNDIVIVGDNGMIWHFNGLTWRRYDELLNPLDRLRSVAIGHDRIIAVGYRYYNGVEIYGVVYHGRR